MSCFHVLGDRMKLISTLFLFRRECAVSSFRRRRGHSDNVVEVRKYHCTWHLATCVPPVRLLLSHEGAGLVGGRSHKCSPPFSDLTQPTGPAFSPPLDIASRRRASTRSSAASRRQRARRLGGRQGASSAARGGRPPPFSAPPPHVRRCGNLCRSTSPPSS